MSDLDLIVWFYAMREENERLNRELMEAMR